MRTCYTVWGLTKLRTDAIGCYIGFGEQTIVFLSVYVDFYGVTVNVVLVHGKKV